MDFLSPTMSITRWLHLLVILIHLPSLKAATNSGDLNALLLLKNQWDSTPPNWVKQDPCGRQWDGITCNSESRVTEINLSGVNLQGSLPEEMPSMSELRTLELSNNPRLSGSLPENIGILINLQSLVLVGCSFYGPIPESIGSLSKLKKLFLNSNRFNGTIPHSVGNLSNLVWFDVTDNQLSGDIPVSNETTMGLDNLTVAQHFHLGRNQLSGVVPSRLFSSKLTGLIHVVLDHNRLTGAIPETLSEVGTLQIIRMDRNFFDDSIPQSLNKLEKLSELYLGNNLLTGSLPDLSNLTSLRYIDLSNNSFNASDFPTWLTSFPNLTTIIMENTTLTGPVPAELFSLSNLETVVLRNNHLNGTLDIRSTGHSDALRLIDLRNNSIDGVEKSTYNYSLLLEGNPVCEREENVCSNPGLNFQKYQPGSSCSSSCSSNKMPRPNDCKCTRPYIGHIIFRSLSFSYLNTSTYFDALNKSLMAHAAEANLPIDSMFLVLAVIDSYQYLNLTVAFFPSVEDSFNMTGIASIGNDINDHKYRVPPDLYGPCYFIAVPPSSGKGKTKLAIILGVVISALLLVLLVLTGLYAYRQRKNAHVAARQKNPFASWGTVKGGGNMPQIKEAKWHSFEDMRKITNDFSEEHEIGRGGYGKVYKGTLHGGQVVAIKRARQGSMQGALEFKTEIELLSRVHHKNIVNLVGFCFDHGEQMLIYEYIKGGTLSSMIAGKLKMQLDWAERLKVALGAARGLAYLHDFADPPIIHRDIKSSNILLDERLNAKVADFGLSKLVNLEGNDHFETEIRGTLKVGISHPFESLVGISRAGGLIGHNLPASRDRGMGYLDPEYYSSNILTEKSDVYSFGIVMLELLTGKRPIEKGKHIVRAVTEELREPTSIYTLVDPAIDSDISMVGLKEYLNLALRCVEEYSAGRPSMRDVVKELESLMETAGMATDLESRTNSIASFAVTDSESPYTSSDPTSSSVTWRAPLLR